MELAFNLSTRLAYQHKSLIDIIEGLSDEQIRRQIISGKWSIFENIVHLQTYQHIFVKRIEQILENNNPSFSRYTAEADPAYLDNCEKSFREIMHDLITVRKQLAATLNSLSSVQLKKTGTHPVFGVMTVSQWLNFFLLHEAHHLYTILNLAAALKKSY